MNLLITAPCFGDIKQADLFIKSAEKFNIPVQFYGLGKQYADWVQVKANELIPWLSENANKYSHVLYTDAFDTLWLKDVNAIFAALRFYGNPMLLFATESEPYPDGEWPSVGGRYLNAGGFMGYLPYVLNCLISVKNKYHVLGGNDQHWWQQALKDRFVVPTFDQDCKIWHTMSGKGSSMTVDSCILHFNGRTGENEVMEEWWRKYDV